jgi:hypothetical protein
LQIPTVSGSSSSKSQQITRCAGIAEEPGSSRPR